MDVSIHTARDYRFDLLRIFACFGVVVLHTTGQFQADPSRDAGTFLAVALHSLSRAAVPLFVMLAGFFALPRLHKPGDGKEFLKRRFSRIWIPTFVWSLFYIAVLQIDRGTGPDGSTLHSWLYHGKPGAGYHLWFLYMLIGLELVGSYLATIYRHFPRTFSAFLVVLFIGTSYFMTFYTEAGGIDGRSLVFVGFLSIAYLPYWFLGRSLGKFALQRMGARRRNLQRIAIGVTVAACIATILAIYQGNYAYARNDLLPFCLLLALGEYAFALTLPRAPKWKHGDLFKKCQRAIFFISELTFGIYLSHVFFLAAFSRLLERLLHVDLSTSPWASLGLLFAVLLASGLFTAVLKNLPVVRRLV